MFGADDFVAISEDLWISVKELNCMNELVSRVVENDLAHPRWSSLHSFVSGGDSDRVRIVL